MSVRGWLMTATCGAALGIGPTPQTAGASADRGLHPGELLIELERLMRVGRVLYVAAHPDDENTRLLGYLANGRHLETSYLSMTRGGGGQNLIGPEQAELLGVIRTQELLAARRVDGAGQFFTRAIDFGYSKTPEETLKRWGREAVLSDIVWVIRSFRPDVIITRFSDSGGGHGHHTASAILAKEGFAAAADPNRFPRQLASGATVWQASRLLLNVPSWRRDRSELERFMSLDAGGYDARLGMSYGELAAISRSQHKSQGFGSSGRRGPQTEYFQHLAGSIPRSDPLDGLRLDWTRIRGGSAVFEHLRRARRNFDPIRPERSVPALLDAHGALGRLVERDPSDPRLRDKRLAVEQTIAGAIGLFARARAERPEAAPGDPVKVELELIVRRPIKVALTRIGWPDRVDRATRPLAPGTPLTVERTVHVGGGADDATRDPGGLRQTAVTPERPPTLRVELGFSIGGARFALDLPVVHTWSDPVLGERRRRFDIVPFATVTPVRPHVMFPRGVSRPVSVVVRSAKAGLKARVRLEGTAGWRVKPAVAAVALDAAGDETTVTFEVAPPRGARGRIEARPVVELADTQNGRTPARSDVRADLIDHPHIPVQRVLRDARMRFVPMDFEARRGPVGYVQGSGDSVPDSLRQVGLTVEELDDETLRSGAFARYRTIVLGIRAYNTRGVLPSAYEPLMAWVKQGGTLVVQYNTNNRWQRLNMPIGPFPLEIDRGRITDETAAMDLVDPQHPVLLRPNRLTPADFDGWVQERGLYFARSWDERYRPIFRTRDPGEPPQEGSVVVTRVGKGAFIYTGLSFFRQLPAGVPGAYRLFANLLAFGD